MKTLNILFDCDGTLMKSLNVGMDAYNFALEKVGARPHEADEIKRFFGQAANKIFMKLLNDEKKADEAFEAYIEFSNNYIDRIHPHDGIVELISNLQGAGARLGVVTGRHSRDLELIFSKNNFGKYFEVMICDDSLTQHKPHPEGLWTAAAKMGLNAYDCIYIGDAVMDMQAANAAGMSAVAALWDDWAKEEDMKIESPALLAKTPAEIWNWLKL